MVTDNLPKAVVYKNGTLLFLDQTKLPLKVIYEEQHTKEQIYDSIKMLKLEVHLLLVLLELMGL